MITVAQVGNYDTSSANGVHQVITMLARSLVVEGICTEVWHFTRSVTTVKISEPVVGVRIVDLPVLGPRGRIGAYLQLPRLTSWKYLYGRVAVDVVHLHSVRQPDHLWVSFLRIPRLLSPHGGYHAKISAGRNSTLKKLWVRLFDRFVLDRVCLVHTLGPDETLAVRHVAPGTPLREVPNSLVLGERKRASIAAFESKPIVYIGRIDDRQKGLDVLLLAWAELAASGFHLPPLSIVGPRDSDAAKRVMKQASALRLTENVFFPGPVYGEEKDALLREARCIILPSRWEGMPVSGLEALSCGVPLLATRATNLGDVIDRYRCGFILGADAAGVKECITTFLTTSEIEIDDMGARARKAAEDLFDWRIVREQWVSIYTNLARQGSTPDT